MNAPLAELAVSLLIRGEHEKYQLDAAGSAALDNAVRALIAAELADRETFLELAAIAHALETQLESPSAARAIIRTLARVPEISRWLPELALGESWIALQGGREKKSELPDGPKMPLSSMFSAPRRC